MRNKSLTYYLAIVLLLDILFVFWSSKAIIDRVIGLQHLKDAWALSAFHALWFYGPSVFSLFLVTFSSIFLFAGCFKALYSEKINKFIVIHIFINFLIFIFCFPFTLVSSGDELVGLMGIRIFNSYVYAAIILAEVILYAMIKHKEVSISNNEGATSLSRFYNLLIDTCVIVMIVLIIKDILYFNFNQEAHARILVSLVIFLYYFLSEVLFKQTIGKIITNTRVRASGNFFKQLSIRTLCRLIPFYQVSALIGNKQPWHDKFSNTRVVKDIDE